MEKENEGLGFLGVVRKPAVKLLSKMLIKNKLHSVALFFDHDCKSDNSEDAYTVKFYDTNVIPDIEAVKEIRAELERLKKRNNFLEAFRSNVIAGKFK